MAASRRSIASPALLVVSALVVAACSAGGLVEVEQSDAIDGRLVADGEIPVPDASSGLPRPNPGPAAAPLAWGTCVGYGIPDADFLGTDRWECARLEVPMDHDDPVDADLPPVRLALTRHPASEERAGSILVNPGGPGGAGLPLAWNLLFSLPEELLDAFDIVSWDPRGVGQSTPAVECRAGSDPADLDYIDECVERTGALSTRLSAPYSAHDMESIRVALDEPTLDYLGYSYGAVLGAVYAERFPDRVGRFVLDGATDPLVGGADGPFEDGFPTFADDGRDAALGRFVELCDATERCLGDAATADVLDDLRDDVGDLPTPGYRRPPASVDREVFDLLVERSLGSAAEWELLATALADAVAGDASALAAMVASDPELAPPGADPGPGSADDGSAPDNFADANMMIYCADLGSWIEDWSFCDAMPANGDALDPVAPVDTPAPILVIGTEFDPLTPGRHARDFAVALGDASHLIWEGVGHTAFPGWTDCIDGAVVRQFLGRPLPPGGTRCPFSEPGETDAELADSLFGYGANDGPDWVAGALVARGDATFDDAFCVADAIVDLGAPDDRLISHVILEVDSADAERALADALAGC